MKHPSRTESTQDRRVEGTNNLSESERHGKKSQKRIFTYWFLILILLIGHPILQGLPWQGSSFLHSVMEVLAICLALSVALVSLFCYYHKKSEIYLLIGTGFLGTAFLDGYHAVITSSFLLHPLHVISPLSLVWSWLASRIFLSLILWLSWLADKVDQEKRKADSRQEAGIYLVMVLLTVAIFLSFTRGALPVAYASSTFLPRPQELIPAVFFFLAFLGFLRKGAWRYDDFEHWLLCSLLLGFLGQSVYLAWSTQLNDPMFEAAHVLKLLSYVCLLLGLLVNFFNVVRQVEKSSDEILREKEILQQDLATSQQVELALKEERDIVSAFLEIVGALVVVLDREGRILRFNRACEETMGYSSEEVLGKPFWDYFLVPDEIESVKVVFQSLKSGQFPMKYENYWLTKDRRRRLIAWSNTALTDPRGEVDYIIGTGIDITEKKEAEQQLLQSEEQYRLLITSLQAGVVVHAPDTRLILANPKASELLGLTMDQMLGKTAVDPDWCFLREDKTSMPVDEYPVNQVITTGRSLDNYVVGVNRPVSRDRVWTLVNAFPHFGVDHQLQQVVVSFLDITARMQAEDLLRLDEARLEALISIGQMQDASLHKITDFALEQAVLLTRSQVGYLAFMSDDESILTMHSWSKTAMGQCAIIDKPIVYPVKSTGLWGEAVRQRKPVITNDYPEPNPLKKGYPEGHVPILRHMNIPVFDGDRIVAVAGVGNKQLPYDDSDIRQLTLLMSGMWRILQRRRAKEELYAEKERLSVTLASLNDGVITTDREGRVVLLNCAAEALTGWTQRAAAGRNLTEVYQICDEFSRSLIQDSFEFALQTAPTREVLLVGRDGSERNIAENGAPICLEAGEILGVVLAFRDITARKKNEKELRQYRTHLEDLVKERTQELLRSNLELEQFAYVASHDLQEPLRKIQAFGDRLSLRCKTLLDDKGQDYLDRMLKASSRMQTLINDLLTFSRVTTKQQPFVSVNLGETLQQVLSDLESNLEETGGNVEIGEMVSLDADPTQMRQLLQNLVGNALKFHRPGEAPKIHVLCELLTRDGHVTSSLLLAEECQILVKDQGIGFDEKYLDRIFKIFQRLHDRTEYPGTGIGLAVCQKIVERHGGTITAQSGPTQGATFIVRLPLKQRKGDTHRDEEQESDYSALCRR